MSDDALETLDYQPRRGRGPRRQHFWRATAYLRPYRRLVVASVLMALLAGGVFAGTIPAILPILQTLLNGDTPQMWIDRKIAEVRWGIDLADDVSAVRIEDTELGGPATEATIFLSGRSQTSYISSHLAESRNKPDELLRSIAEASTGDWMGGVTGVQPRQTPPHLRLTRKLIYLLPSNPVGAIAVIMVGIFLLAALQGLIRFAQEYLSAKAALRAINDIRRDLYAHILRVPMSYFGARGTGDVTSRIVNDAAQLQQGFTTLLGPAVQQPILAFFAFIVAMIIDWRLTIFIVAFAPIAAVVLRRFGRKMRRVGGAALVNSAELLGQVESTLSGIRVVKANVAEEHESSRLKAILSRLLRFQLKMQKYDAASGPTLEVLAVGGVGVIVVMMVYLVRQEGTLSVAGALLIFGCLAQMADSLRRLSKLNVVLQKSNAAAERIFEAIDLPSEAAEQRSQSRKEAKRDAKADKEPAEQAPAEPSVSFASGFAPLRLCDLRPFSREIAFENVSFRYHPEAPPALDGISLAVRKGESIAIVGRNGSGKTTLLSLLPRFFDPDEGRVLIDGADIREVPLASLRSQIGVVTQEAVIFPGTIAENIAYAQEKATSAQIESAARQAEAHEFIMARPLGYDTPLTGLGSGLSGGQRQRLNIARAILRDPPILILDEATSQVDAESEHLIQQAIHRLMQGRTVFVIAHRFSTILDCDRIALLEQGRLEALGTHEELVETSELYRQLYDRQLVGVS